MNPYASPLTRTDPPPPRTRDAWEVLGPAVIALALAAAAVGGSLAPFFPVINQATMPRFGWSGLLLCANPLIFLLPWFWTRARNGLLDTGAVLEDHTRLNRQGPSG